ncbi:uncharacterized protein BBA_09891 [Beauveria bassiana ARSEF 2860]|uniref:Uncharacterized protein n=1 Tax=Beauveria bassiana (strain ARSEF 2860) TaxID=655819 RepID=J4VR66_BEAB2|nr:uncharacterized protein BBA_09891 [Beauveria bassiana ARSEF 2860]EJP61145.1 hypothetical protein BBA_09891 [Beauveria bassiana ARSEF 2860]
MEAIVTAYSISPRHLLYTVWHPESAQSPTWLSAAPHVSRWRSGIKVWDQSWPTTN